MGDSSDFSNTYVIELTGKTMVVAIIILFIVVVFLFSLHLYAKLFWCRRQENPSTAVTTSRRRRQEPTLISTLTHGLDPTLLKTLPVVMFDPHEFEDGLECSVCLSEVSKGERTRLLPKCNHGFHLDCIDMWFTSHSTCPLCRHPVSYRKESDPRDESVLEDVVLVENPNFPTNVLFWGDESRVSAFGPCLDEENRISSGSEPSSSSSSSSSSSLLSSSSSSASDRFNGVIVIDVPRQINEEEEQKSPVPTRLRSLKRLLSGNRRVINPSSPRNLDIEQGNRGQS